MNTSTLFAQLLNGFQFGVLLFLLSAGLTLVLGIMNFVNLAHGSLFMAGAYFAAAAYGWTGSFPVAVLTAVAGTLLLGMAMERIVLSRLYARDHLYQMLATIGLILVLNEMAGSIWGRGPLFVDLPDQLSGTLSLFGLEYPLIRLAIIAV